MDLKIEDETDKVINEILEHWDDAEDENEEQHLRMEGISL